MGSGLKRGLGCFFHMADREAVEHSFSAECRSTGPEGISRPLVHLGSLASQVCAYRSDVFGIAGQHIALESHRHGDEMGVHDIGRLGAREQVPHCWSIVEWMHRQGLDKRREPGLSGAIAPDLCKDRMRCVQRGLKSAVCKDGLCRILAPICRDQEAGVEDHRP